MSLHALLAVRQHQCRAAQKVSAAAQKAVLFHLADRALPDGTIYPTSVRQLAKWTQHERRHVQLIQDALVQTGDLVVIEEPGVYKVALFRLGDWYAPEDTPTRRGVPTTPGGVPTTPGGASRERPNGSGRRSTSKTKALSPTEARLLAEQERAEAVARALYPAKFAEPPPTKTRRKARAS